MGAAEVAAAGDRLGETDQRRDAADAEGELLDRALVGRDEVALQVEVLGRVAGDAELGEDRQLGALRFGAVDPLRDLRRVAVDVADGRVDLGQGYAHVSVLTGVRAEVSPPDAELACRLPGVRSRLRLIGASLAALVVFAAVPAGASAGSQWFFHTPAARPTDHPDPNRNAYTVPEAPRSPACTRHFCVHWVAEGIDAPNLADSNGDGVPDYVERVQAVAEHVHSIENGKLGWREPMSDGRIGGGRGKTDIYLAEIGGALFGYAAPDRGQSTKAHRLPRHLHGYLVLDNDYAPSEFPGTTPSTTSR